jgi:hypothetical protein
MTKVLIANDLRSGAVVYLDTQGAWTEVVANARPLMTDEDESAAMAEGTLASENNLVVGIETIPLSAVEPSILPERLREIIRAAGPTVRPDLARATR